VRFTPSNSVFLLYLLHVF